MQKTYLLEPIKEKSNKTKAHQIMKKHFILGLFLSAIFPALSQTETLNLDEALKQLEANAYALKMQNKNVDMLKEHLAASKQHFLPQIGVQYTGVYTNSPLNSFGFKLEQQVVTQADFAPNLLNNPDGISNFNTQVNILQPIFNYDAQLAQKMLNKQVQAVELQTAFALNQLQLELKNAYVNLQLLYAAQTVLEESEEALNAHLKIIEDFIQQGVAKNADELGIQVKLKEVDNQKIEVAKNIANVSAYINYLIGEEEAKTYQPAESIEAEHTTSFTETSISDNRPDLLAYQKGIEAQQENLKMTKAKNLPRLNAFGAFNLNDESPFGFGGDNFVVGATLSWQLHLGKQLKGTTNAQKIAIEKSQIELENAKAQSNLALQQALQEQKALRAEIENAEASLKLAEEQLRVTQNRFKEGLEKSADVLVVENKLSQTKLKIQQLHALLKQQMNQIEFLLKS